MKNVTRRMKKVAPLVLLGLLLDHSPVNQSAQALVGGPFDDNQYPGVNADGTYSGTISGKNLIGMVMFGVNSSAESNGRFSVFHEGSVHYGAASGQVDLASRRVFGSLLGVATVTGDGFGAGIVETTGGSGNITTNSGQTITVRSGAEGAFKARLKGYPQQIVFEGEGRLATIANNAVLNGRVQAGDDFTVTIVTPTNPDDINNEPGTDDVGLGGQLQSGQLRSETPFKVRGSRTSRAVFVAFNNYASVAPIVPTTGGTPGATAVPTVAPAP